LGMGDWGLGPIPNPQSPIPKFLFYKYIAVKKAKKFYNLKK